MGNKTCALICAFNEENAIGNVVRKAKLQLDDVIVVDDGSGDGTMRQAIWAGAGVIQHSLNRGKGEALRTGFDYCLERGYDRIVTLDADGQHLPKHIPEFSGKLDAGHSVAIGRRDFSEACVPLARRWGNRFDSYVLSMILGADIQDPQNGYRMFQREALEKALGGCKNSGFTFELELLVKLARNGEKIAWVPIETIYSPKIKSHQRPLKHIMDSVSLYAKAMTGVL